jgi:hypothetical protein
MKRRTSTSSGYDTREQPRRQAGHMRSARALVWRLALVVLGALALVAATGTPVTRADGPPSLSIVVPVGLAGPDGANVSAQLQGALHKHAYIPGYASTGQGCAAGFVAATGLQPVTTNSNGNAVITIPWPQNSGIGTFYVCAQDLSDPTTMIQSSNQYTVLSDAVPSISIVPAPTPTPTPGDTTGTPPPTASGPDGIYTTGQQVVVTGSGFLPGGSTVAVYISGDTTKLGMRISDDPVNADTNGNFSTTVTLPGSRAGNLFLQAATLDGHDGMPPSLMAAAPITVRLAPTPTPTVSPSPVPSPTVPIRPTPGNGAGGGGDVARTIGIAGLGSFSVLLLIIGAYLLMTAGGLGREE